MTKPIIDVCCGGKMFWFDKHNPNVEFCDKRKFETHLCDGRAFEVNPDTVCDFTQLPFADNTYKLVVFDPPHILKVGEESWTAKKYGKLPDDWWDVLSEGFAECFRVLEPYGILIFKWSDIDIKVSEILKLTPYKPLFGHKSGRLNKTHWITFMKLEETDETQK